jgi:hypothetical protein
MARMAFLLALVALVGTAEVRSARAQDPRPVPLARRGVRAACPRTIDAALSAIGTKGGIGRRLRRSAPAEEAAATAQGMLAGGR